MLAGSTRLRRGSGKAVGFCKPSVDLRYALQVSGVQYAAIIGYAEKQIGRKYNFLDIMGILFRSRLNSPHRLICSQFVMEIFQAGGIQLLNVLNAFDHKITPRDVHLTPLFIGKRV